MLKSRRRQKQHLKPEKERIAIARKRICGVMEKNHGVIEASSDAMAINFFCRTVYNRGCSLGMYEDGEFAAIVRKAYRELKSEGILVLDADTFTLGYNGTLPTHKTHRDKYGGRPLRRPSVAF